MRGCLIYELLKTSTGKKAKEQETEQTDQTIYPPNAFSVIVATPAELDKKGERNPLINTTAECCNLYKA